MAAYPDRIAAAKTCRTNPVSPRDPPRRGGGRKEPLMGSLYKQKSRDGTQGRIWWIKYYVNGRPVRESTRTEKEAEAKRVMKEREGRAATGQPIVPRADRIRYEEIATDLAQHYDATGTRNVKEFAYRVKHLDRFFAGARIASLGQPEVNRYIAARRTEGARDATIRRELGTLTTMLRLAVKNGKLLRPPTLVRPKEGPPREGFFERAQYEAVRAFLAPDLQVATAIAYTFGWRMQSEVLKLERRQLDPQAGTLRLDTGSTKNRDGRLVYVPPDLHRQLRAQVARVRTLERKLKRIIPYLFPHLTGAHKGDRRRDFRKAWATACAKAGYAHRFEKDGRTIIRPLFIRHDLRRTAVRNMVNRGVRERVAMAVTGHKTRAVFDRYHIVSPADLQDVARKLTGITTGITKPVRSRRRS